MKKVFAIVLAVLLVFALMACGAKDAVQDAVRDVLDDSSTPSSSPATTSTPAAPDTSSSETGAGTGDGAAMESLIDWMMGGTFSYDFTLYSEYDGMVSEGKGSVAMSGGNYAMTSEQTTDGVTSKARILVLDDVTYIIDDESKLIMKMSGGGLDLTGGMPTDYEEMVETGSGEGEVNGRTLPYTEYTVEGVVVRYYMDGGMVYATESTYEGSYSLMIITNATNTVPAGAFDLPEGYMEMEI